MTSVITYVFKIIGALVLSLLLWGLFMGSPDSNAAVGNTETVTFASYVNRGSAFEKQAYGDRLHGFKAYTAETWIAGTGANGLQTAATTEPVWDKACNSFYKQGDNYVYAYIDMS